VHSSLLTMESFVVRVCVRVYVFFIHSLKIPEFMYIHLIFTWCTCLQHINIFSIYKRYIYKMHVYIMHIYKMHRACTI